MNKIKKTIQTFKTILWLFIYIYYYKIVKYTFFPS